MRWIGKGKTQKTAVVTTVASPFDFGGEHFGKGRLVKAFETANFGWVIRQDELQPGERRIVNY